MISMNYGSSTSSWKSWKWVRHDLIFTMMDTYISFILKILTKLTWTEFSIFSQEAFLKWPRRLFQQNSHSYAMKQGIKIWVWPKVNRNRDNHMIRISQWSVSHCRANNSVIRNKKTQKNRTVRVTLRDMSRKVTHLNEVIWDNKKLL